MSTPSLQIYSGHDYETYSRKYKARNQTIPRLLLDAISATAEMTDPTERVKYLLMRLQHAQLAPSTANKYLHDFERLLGIEHSQVRLNKLAFKPMQSRYVPLSELDTLYEHFVSTGDLLMTFCFVTGLRSMEVAQTTTRHLDDLTQRLTTTTIVLKGGKKQWRILWTPDLVRVVDLLAVEFAAELDYYRRTGATINLWHLQPLSISVKFKRAYLEVMRKQPPLGFGLHNVRYYWATKYADNLVQAKLKLNHSHLSTTKSYVKLNATEVNFDALNSSPFYQAIYSG